MIQSDPPQHTRLRKLVAREFTGRRIEDLRPGIERVAGELLDTMPAATDHRADPVEAFALPLPITVRSAPSCFSTCRSPCCSS